MDDFSFRNPFFQTLGEFATPLLFFCAGPTIKIKALRLKYQSSGCRARSVVGAWRFSFLHFKVSLKCTLKPGWPEAADSNPRQPGKGGGGGTKKKEKNCGCCARQTLTLDKSRVGAGGDKMRNGEVATQGG